MKSLKLLAVCIIAVFQAACDKATTTQETNINDNRREISNTLLSSCPQNSAARMSADTVPGITIVQQKSYIINASIYTQDGNIIGKISAAFISDTLPPTKSIVFHWNGKDSTGKEMPTGNYFFYYSIADTTQNTNMHDSLCIKYTRS